MVSLAKVVLPYDVPPGKVATVTMACPACGHEWGAVNHGGPVAMPAPEFALAAGPDRDRRG